MAVFALDARTEEQITLRLSDWHLTEGVWNKPLKDAMELFQQQHPSITVILEPVTYAEKEAKYLSGFEQNKAPDIFRLHAFSLPLFSGKGYTLDLTPFLEKEGAGFLTPWYPLTLDLMKSGGKMHAMPGDYMVMIVLYNTELFKAAGLDPAKPPKTWDEFLEYAQKLTRDTNGDGRIDQWGFGTVGTKDPGFTLRFSSFLWSFGGGLLNPRSETFCAGFPGSQSRVHLFCRIIYTVQSRASGSNVDDAPGCSHTDGAAKGGHDSVIGLGGSDYQ